MHHIQYWQQKKPSIQYMEIQALNGIPIDRAMATLTVNGRHDIAFQIDTGAACNILPFRDYVQVTGDKEERRLRRTNVVLVMHNRAHVKPRGAAWFDIKQKSHKYNIHFIVVPNKNNALAQSEVEPTFWVSQNS